MTAHKTEPLFQEQIYIKEHWIDPDSYGTYKE